LEQLDKKVLETSMHLNYQSQTNFWIHESLLITSFQSKSIWYQIVQIIT